MSMKMSGPFLHIVGALLLFGGLGVEWALSARSAAPWRSPGRSEGRGDRGMAAALDLFDDAWVNVSIVAVISIAALAGVVPHSRRRAADLPIGRLWPASLAIRIALVLGVLYLMVSKPGAFGSLVAMTLALALGAVAAKRTRPAVRVEAGDDSFGASARS